MRKVVAIFVASAAGLLFSRAASTEENTVQLLTPDGKGEVSLECSCSDAPGLGCLIGHRVNKDVVFVLPEGYRRGQFSSEVQPHGLHSGGSVDWLEEDRHDARIRLHCWADAFSSATVTVSGVTGVRE